MTLPEAIAMLCSVHTFEDKEFGFSVILGRLRVEPEKLQEYSEAWAVRAEIGLPSEGPGSYGQAHMQ
jgi:hypothetical protein